MKRNMLVPIGAALLLACVCTGCNKLRARSELNNGVIAFRNSDFAEAVNHFQRAVSYDPTMLDARLYLATALAQQYVPEGNTPDNIAMGKRAIAAYQNVLQINPRDTRALGSIANLYYHMHDFDQAKAYEQKVMQIEPNDPDPYYWIGLLDWNKVYLNSMQLRAKVNLEKPQNPAKSQDLPPLPSKLRDQLEQQNTSLIQEGIDNLQKAIQLKPNDANAYSYLGLIYRRKGEDLDASKDDRQADLQKANDLASKGLALMKAAPATHATSSNAG
jgi:tetratricopeptide (TPR) repeat protein